LPSIPVNLVRMVILAAWNKTASYIASGHEAEFSGRSKEGLVFRRLGQNIACLSPGIRVELEVPFDRWRIDLVGSSGAEHVAVEGKFKLRSDGAVPDNRKAAFLDLYKLEQYVGSGRYSRGIFVWLTDEALYLRKGTGDSADFSTHDGRIYQPSTPLNAKRSRSGMPLPLVLTQQYDFQWQQISNSKWYCLVLTVLPTGQSKTQNG
jgi:hypothetical protein